MLPDSVLKALNDTDILFLTLWGETRGEPIQGQVAVGCVIRNRVHSIEKYHNSYTEVCLAPKQFSCWNEDDTNYPILIELGSKLVAGQDLADPHYRQVMLVAEGIISWAILDNTKGATNYMTRTLWQTDKPHWATRATNIQDVGSQVFFNA